MKVDFNFGATAEITLTPESPREESLVKMCYEVDTYPVVFRTGANVLKLTFCTGVKSYNLSNSLTIGEIGRD